MMFFKPKPIDKGKGKGGGDKIILRVIYLLTKYKITSNNSSNAKAMVKRKKPKRRNEVFFLHFLKKKGRPAGTNQISRVLYNSIAFF